MITVVLSPYFVYLAYDFSTSLAKLLGKRPRCPLVTILPGLNRHNETLFTTRAQAYIDNYSSFGYSKLKKMWL